MARICICGFTDRAWLDDAASELERSGAHVHGRVVCRSGHCYGVLVSGPPATLASLRDLACDEPAHRRVPAPVDWAAVVNSISSLRAA